MRLFENILLRKCVVFHPRLASPTVANSQGVGLSVPYKSIEKYLALPTRDSGYKSVRTFAGT